MTSSISGACACDASFHTSFVAACRTLAFDCMASFEVASFRTSFEVALDIAFEVASFRTSFDVALDIAFEVASFRTSFEVAFEAASSVVALNIAFAVASFV